MEQHRIVESIREGDGYAELKSIRRAFVIMMIGMVLDVAGLILAIICSVLPNPYSSLFVSTVIHINA
ncbi:hypothetical protein TELCIR_15654, partial [Teladorsagia circumcincta]